MGLERKVPGWERGRHEGVDRKTQLGVGEGTGRGPGARGERVPGAAVTREAQLAGPAGGGGGGSAPLTQAASQCLWR